MTYLRRIIFKTTYSKLINLCLSDSINTNIRHLETCQCFTVFIFKILDYLIYSGCLMHKNGIKARFIGASPKFSITPLARTMILVLVGFLDKYKHIMINLDLLRALKMFG